VRNSARVGGSEFGEEEFEDGAGRFGAAFEAVVGFLEGLEAGEKAGLEILRALAGRVRLEADSCLERGRPGNRCSRRGVRCFHEFAIAPGKRAENLERLLTFAENAIEKFERAFGLARGEHVGEFPDGCCFFGDDECSDVVAADEFSFACVRGEFRNFGFEALKIGGDGFGEIFGGSFSNSTPSSLAMTFARATAAERRPSCFSPRPT